MDIKGMIIAPTEIGSSFMDRFKILFQLLSKEIGFAFYLRDTWSPSIISLLSNVDVVITYGLFTEAAELNKRIKLISMVGDIHSQKKENRDLKHRIWQRADYIWTGGDEMFSKAFSQWYCKHIWVPMFFASHERYTSLSFNENPKMKCLLSGCAHLPWYPLRHYVNIKGNPSLIEKPYQYLRKGGKTWRYVKDDYAKWLNLYFCSLTCTGNHSLCQDTGTVGGNHGGGIFAKQLEIPATGSLLISDYCEDMMKVGFVPGKNFVVVERNNVLDKIKYYLEYSNKFVGIRKEGMEFVRENHSVKNRVRELKTVIERICNEEKVGGESCISLARE